MDQDTELMLRVAKNYLTKSLLPAVALATNLSGCATDLPTVKKVPNIQIKLNNSLDDLLNLAPEQLSDLLQEVRDLQFKDAEDVKARRHNYFTRIRAYIDDPIQIKYNKLSEAEKRKLQKVKTQVDRAIQDTEQKMAVIFDQAHLKFKPWQRERFEQIRKSPSRS